MDAGGQGGRERLQDFIEANADSLTKTLRYYVLRAGLASGTEVAQVTDEVFNDMVVEALRTAIRLKPDIHPKPWLLGISANLIKRRQTAMAKRDRREPLMRDLFPQDESSLSDEELFDQLPIIAEGRQAEWEADEPIIQLLSLLSKEDADLLRLAILNDLNGDKLAKVLHISPGAARVRLHRALKRLRTAVSKQAQEANHG